MKFQELGRLLEHRGSGVEFTSFVCEEDNVINTVAFESDGIIVTLFDDGTYELGFGKSFGEKP